MVYKTIDPSQLMPGDRVVYLGSLRTVVEAGPGRGRTTHATFLGGMEAHLIDPVSIVDEERTRTLLARYA